MAFTCVATARRFPPPPARGRLGFAAHVLLRANAPTVQRDVLQCHVPFRAVSRAARRLHASCRCMCRASVTTNQPTRAAEGGRSSGALRGHSPLVRLSLPSWLRPLRVRCFACRPAASSRSALGRQAGGRRAGGKPTDLARKALHAWLAPGRYAHKWSGASGAVHLHEEAPVWLLPGCCLLSWTDEQLWCGDVGGRAVQDAFDAARRDIVPNGVAQHWRSPLNTVPARLGTQDDGW